MAPLFLGVIPYGWVYLSERFFYAFEDGRTVFVVQCLVTGTATAVTALASLASPERTAVLVGAGQSAAYAIGGVLGFALIRRRIGPVGLRRVAGAYVRLLLPAVATGLLGLLVLRLAGPAAVDDRLNGGLLLLGVGALVLLGTLVAAHLLGVREVRDLLGPLLSRVRRR
jgi:putative peptidoglycan lipid II flippase